MITSEGRFNGGLSVSGQVLTAMPRAKASSGVYYELTAIAAGSGSVVASQVMPHSFRPSNAIYMNNAFAFTIPASYDYGGGIANVGTYYPIAGNTMAAPGATVTHAAGHLQWLAVREVEFAHGVHRYARAEVLRRQRA